MTIFCTCHTATIIQPLENKHNSLKRSSIQDILCTIIHYCATTTVHTAQAQVPLICQINPPIHLPVHLFSPIRHRASFQIKIHNMRHLAALQRFLLILVGVKISNKEPEFLRIFYEYCHSKGSVVVSKVPSRCHHQKRREKAEHKFPPPPFRDLMALCSPICLQPDNICREGRGLTTIHLTSGRRRRRRRRRKRRRKSTANLAIEKWRYDKTNLYNPGINLSF